ncbi:pyridoxal phosphate-dependent transferase [Lineolata rhizophorae]|uniref:Pyridoxal phosphate-dependent transferase n=1 Tax=Lineolata rhizophorae TaxID=578093 RepID=A0A6A6PD87_9PEZI|nr:pyridoxal phosphate-dependent transferase [Lineolata rhizophorae]
MSPAALIEKAVESKDTNGSIVKGSAVLHRHLHYQPHRVVRASGSNLWLDNGQKVFDSTGGAAVACLGHCNERVKKAVMRQMNEVSYCHSLFFSTSSAEALATELTRSTDGHMTKAFIVSSGSEAMEAALKLARQFHLEKHPPQPQRTRFIARRESYHGTTLGALSVGGHLARRALFEPMLIPKMSWVSPCNAYRGKYKGESDREYVARLAQELDDEFTRVGSDTVCAFVAEPVVGAALGCVPAVAGYFAAMKKVCDKHGALLILDEVMCGMGRTGTLHAWQQEGIVPDLQTIGKALGGGYAPVAGLLINQRVVDVLDKGTGAFAHGQTYQGHPVACAAALEVQRIVREDRLLENVKAMGKKLEAGLKDRLETHPHVGNIRGRGLFWGIEIVEDKATKKPFDPKESIAMGLHEKGMMPKYGISLYPGAGTVDGKCGDHVLLAPAFNVSEADIDFVVDMAARVVEDFFAEY